MTPIDEAVALLRAGELIGLPTETVYGLAADAENPSAVRKIFSLKGRPADHPVIIHLADSARLVDWATEISDQAWQLAAAFWPGPMTLVLPKQPWVDGAITGGQQTVAIRVPRHPVAQQILLRFGGAVVAPSANRFGHVSPTQAQHVRDEFGADLPLVVEGGDCEVGLESTIINLVGSPELLRPGSIGLEQIEVLLAKPVSYSNRMGQRAPGLLDKHYSPVTPAWLVASTEIEGKLLALRDDGKRVGLLTLRSYVDAAEVVELLSEDPGEYGRHLYSALRRLDAANLDLILIEKPPEAPAWLAVNDRINRATQLPD